MYDNPELIETTKQIFSIFLWPYLLIEKRFIGLNLDFSHKFHPLWSSVGALLSFIYIALIGNAIYLIVNQFFSKKTSNQ
jgi:hypothetical protein